MSEDSRRIYNKERHWSRKKSFCSATQNSMYFHSDGSVQACCFNHKSLGNYPNESIKDIWFGKKYENLNQKLESYDLSDGCDACEYAIATNNHSMSNSLRFDGFKVKKLPTTLSFNLSNTCNLQCVMCNGSLSSTIRKNREGLPPLPQFYDLEFARQLEEFIPYLSYCDFAGGEPFLIDLYYEIWERIVEVNPKCFVRIITNGTIWNKRVKRILDKGTFSISISLDSPSAEVYESIRIGSKFDTVIENAAKFSEYCTKKKTAFNFNFCPMPANWFEIPEMLKLCNKLNAKIYFSIVLQPINKSLQSLDNDKLLEVIDCLNRFKIESKEIAEENKAELDKLIEQLQFWIIQNDKALHEPSLDEMIDLCETRLLEYFSKHQMEKDISVIGNVSTVLNRFRDRKVYNRNLYDTMNELSLDRIYQIWSQDVDEIFSSYFNYYFTE